MDAQTLLTTRNSAPKLKAPAPDADALRAMFAAAARVPDHARLRPWRFLTIAGEARHQLGALFAEALRASDPDAPGGAVSRAKGMPTRAPLLIVVIARLQDHPKVPRVEQRLSAGCAAHAILLAAHAQGYAGIWRTGEFSYSPVVKSGLGLSADEEIIGLLYLGTLDGKEKPIPAVNMDEFVQAWGDQRPAD